MNNQNKSKIAQVESIRVGLASPECIRKWAERNINGKIVGQVTSSQTVNYKTLKPEKGGLFCERIFGPVKDFECSCGRKKSQPQQQFCPECLVEFTSSRVRRYRLGYIQLISPVTHVWYLKGTPSYISILLDIRRKKVEAITYCTETTNIPQTNYFDSQNNFENSLKDSKLKKALSLSINSNQDPHKQDKKFFYNKPFNKLITNIRFNDPFELFDKNYKKNKYFFYKREFLDKKISQKNTIYDEIIKNNNQQIKQNLQLENKINFLEKNSNSLNNSPINNLPINSNILNSKEKIFQESEFCSNNNLLSFFLENTDKKKLVQQKTSINNYYSVSQYCSWEIQDDWNKFLYYMTAYPEQQDIPIPTHFNRIENTISQINNFSLTNIQTDMPLTGAEAIHFFLANLDLQLLDRQIRVELFELNEEIQDFENQGFLFFSEQRRLQFLIYIRSKKLRRLKLIRHFRRTKARPEWMVLSVIPVLPPDLRPIIQLDGDQVAVSDLNKLYQKVLFRNNRMKRHRKSNCSNKSDEIKYAQRLLQEAVDALIENGKGGADPICASNDRPLKSLSDMLKGKKGRFRQNLLGKRVDYSGRSVIVVGPKLKIHECGLPKEMAIELFQPFLIRRLMTKKLVRTIVGAKGLIQRQDPIIWEVLEQVLQNHPVLLNRAPTLHRLGIQAFQPKLVDGRAILLHPLVCSAFNADFDGDQMAVHVPLSFQARAEAWKLMWSRNNLLSPATGQPVLVPSQDMVLGCYYLTTTNPKPQLGCGNYFFGLQDAIRAYNQKKISLHTPIWVRWFNLLENGTQNEQPLEIRIDSYGNKIQIYSNFQKDFDVNHKKISQFIRTTPGRILINQQILDTLKAYKK